MLYKQNSVLINYSANGKRHEKIPDKYDLSTIKKIDESKIPYLFPTNELPDGYNTNQPKLSHGFTHVHHFYSKRNLWVLASIYNKVLASKIRHKLIWDFTGIQNVSTKLTNILQPGYFQNLGH